MKLTRNAEAGAWRSTRSSSSPIAPPRAIALLRHSTDTHFSYQADMFLHGHLDLGHPPPNSNDWAEVEYLHLKDGRTVAGTFLRANPSHFRTLNGKVERITDADIANRWKKYYVSFPPFPTLIFLPFVAICSASPSTTCSSPSSSPRWRPMLLFFVLRRLAARGDSDAHRGGRPLARRHVRLRHRLLLLVGDRPGLVHRAHRRHRADRPVRAGVVRRAPPGPRRPVPRRASCSRARTWPPGASSSSTKSWRAHGKKIPCRDASSAFAVPVALLGAAGSAFNWARFRSFGEFGHFYLNVRWTDRIQRYGLFNFAFLARNLTCALTLTPKLLAKSPYVQISWHGMSLLITTPGLPLSPVAARPLVAAHGAVGGRGAHRAARLHVPERRLGAVRISLFASISRSRSSCCWPSAAAR